MVKPVELTGETFFRTRILLSLLSSTPIRIVGIRSDDLNPGIRDYEISLLRLVESITNGTQIEISYTGTAVLFVPGLITGTPKNVPELVHTCPPSSALSYFIEVIFWLTCLAKSQPVSILLEGGCTTANEEMGCISVDLVRVGILPVLKRFGLGDAFELRIIKRGFPPLGKGRVHISSQRNMAPPPRALTTLHLIDGSRITRIRGIAYSAKVNNTITTRLATSARSILNQYVPDSYIYSDTAKDAHDTSPGWGMCLVAESVHGCIYTSELCSSETNLDVEDVGTKCAKMLLYEISLGGTVDRMVSQWVMLGMMLGSEDFGRVRFSAGVVTMPGFVNMVRHGKLFFGCLGKFKDADNDGILAAVRGSGWINSARKAV